MAASFSNSGAGGCCWTCRAERRCAAADSVSRAEKADFLRRAVFEDGEIGVVEVGDEIVLVVHDGDDQMDEAAW